MMERKFGDIKEFTVLKLICKLEVLTARLVELQRMVMHHDSWTGYFQIA